MTRVFRTHGRPRMWRVAMVGVFLLLNQAQIHPTIEVGEDRLLSASGPARPLLESQLSTEPNNSKHLLAGVIQFDSHNPINSTCVAWTSFDGGHQWMRHAFPAQGCADPWGVILPDGSAIMVMLGQINGHDDNLFLFRSPDGGRTWPETPLGLGGHHDHPMVIAQGNQVYDRHMTQNSPPIEFVPFRDGIASALFERASSPSVVAQFASVRAAKADEPLSVASPVCGNPLEARTSLQAELLL